jgi:hypothetical protein
MVLAFDVQAASDGAKIALAVAAAETAPAGPTMAPNGVESAPRDVGVDDALFSSGECWEDRPSSWYFVLPDVVGRLVGNGQSYSPTVALGFRLTLGIGRSTQNTWCQRGGGESQGFKSHWALKGSYFPQKIVLEIGVDLVNHAAWLRPGWRWVVHPSASFVGAGVGVGATLERKHEWRVAPSPELLLHFGLLEDVERPLVILFARWDCFLTSYRENTLSVGVGFTMW